MKKLVAYITAGLPSRDFSIDVALGLAENGVDILELGIPFSDPVADGPVIEKANLKSLELGFKMDDIFYISKEIATKIETLWMGYFNPFYARGVDFYASKAKELGVKGFIIPDLPLEESRKYLEMIEKNSLSLISFVAPTDSKKRIEEILEKDISKFIYLVAYAGITGAAKSEDLNSVVENIREYSSTPIYLGFGVDRDNAKERAKNVDGVIVGSAFVKILMDESLTNSQKLTRITTLSRDIKERINS